MAHLCEADISLRRSRASERFRLTGLPVRLHALLVVWSSLLFLTGCHQSALPHEALVRRVTDGDTIELSTGELVRYIGVDTPEVRRKQGNRWVADPEPFGKEASAFNRQLVEGRRVRLEYDAQTHDRYGRLLAYVYAGELFVNAELLRQGYAQPLTIPPNVAYAEMFRTVAQEARRANRGLWGVER